MCDWGVRNVFSFYYPLEWAVRQSRALRKGLFVVKALMFVVELFVSEYRRFEYTDSSWTMLGWRLFGSLVSRNDS